MESSNMSDGGFVAMRPLRSSPRNQCGFVVRRWPCHWPTHRPNERPSEQKNSRPNTCDRRSQEGADPWPNWCTIASAPLATTGVAERFGNRIGAREFPKRKRQHLRL